MNAILSTYFSVIHIFCRFAQKNLRRRNNYSADEVQERIVFGLFRTDYFDMVVVSLPVFVRIVFIFIRFIFEI